MRPDNMPRPHTPEFGEAQPKLTDARLLQILDNALNCVPRGGENKVAAARTAVAGIIAERDAAVAVLRRIANSERNTNVDLQLPPEVKGGIYFWSLRELAQAALTGTEDQV